MCKFGFHYTILYYRYYQRLRFNYAINVVIVMNVKFFRIFCWVSIECFKVLLKIIIHSKNGNFDMRKHNHFFLIIAFATYSFGYIIDLKLG